MLFLNFLILSKFACSFYCTVKYWSAYSMLKLLLNHICLDTQDHGILRDGSKETLDTDSELAKRTLSQDLNRHAAVVLEGIASGSSRLDRKVVLCLFCFLNWLLKHAMKLMMLADIRILTLRSLSADPDKFFLINYYLSLATTQILLLWLNNHLCPGMILRNSQTQQ